MRNLSSTCKYDSIAGDSHSSLRRNILPGAALHDPRVLAAAAQDVQRTHPYPGTDADVDKTDRYFVRLP